MKQTTMRFYSRQGAVIKVFTIMLFKGEKLSGKILERLLKLFSQFDLYEVSQEAPPTPPGMKFVEILPQPTYQSPGSSKTLHALWDSGITQIMRCEESIRHFVPETTPTSEFLKSLQNFDSTNYFVLDNVEFTASLYSERKVTEVLKPVRLMGVGRKKGKERLMSTGMDEETAGIWRDYFVIKEKRNPRPLELGVIIYGFTNHSKHPTVKRKISHSGKTYPSVMETVKSTWEDDPGNSVIAFADNSSSIAGTDMQFLISDPRTKDGAYKYITVLLDWLIKVETHCYPTTVSPFQGMATGVGGCMRDIFEYGVLGYLLAAFDLIAVSGIKFKNGFIIPGTQFFYTPDSIASALEILVQGTNGGCSYMNEVGVPCTMGKMHSFSLQLPSMEKFAYHKTNAVMGMVGFSPRANARKGEPKPGMAIVRLGGLGYPVGFGGGLGSSKMQGAQDAARDKAAVQRGDSLVAIEVQKFLLMLMTLGILTEKRVVKSAQDQGAAGICNAAGEIMGMAGGFIDLAKLICAAAMSNTEKLFCEFQESYVFLIEQSDIEFMVNAAKEMGVHIEILGEITGNGRFVVIDSEKAGDKVEVDLSLEALESSVENPPKEVTWVERKLNPVTLPQDLEFEQALKGLFYQLAVGNKVWKVSKGDQTVGARTIQRQFAGPNPYAMVNDVSCIKASHNPKDTNGLMWALGHKPNCILVEPTAGAEHTVAHAFLNLISAAPGTIKLSDINALLNEMWPCGPDGEDLRMNMSVTGAANALRSLSSRIIGGKDSTSFLTKEEREGIIKSLETLLVSLYVPVVDVREIYTPFIKKPGDSYIGLIDLTGGKKNLSGSYFAQSLGQIGDTCHRVDFELLARGAEFILQLKREGLILSCHDTESDGVFVAAFEMALAGCAGLQFMNLVSDDTLQSYTDWFADTVGMLVEYEGENADRIQELAEQHNIPFTLIAITLQEQSLLCTHAGMMGRNMHFKMSELALWYDEISYQVSLEQTTPECALQLHKAVANQTIRPYHVPYEIGVPILWEQRRKPRAAILWDQGSNGISEMAAWVMEGGFEPFDAPMSKIRSGKITLADADGLFPVGGFSNGDMLGSAVGWTAKTVFNDTSYNDFAAFFARKTTVGCGVCNGDQYFTLLDIYFNFMMPNVPLNQRPRLVHNLSGKFDAFEPRIIIEPGEYSNWLTDMGGAELSIPQAHGEGRYRFPKGAYEKYFKNTKYFPWRYAGTDGKLTMSYPENPSGSEYSIAGMLSYDQRFFKTMLHPERALVKENLSWKEGYPETMLLGPYAKLPENAARWLHQYM